METHESRRSRFGTPDGVDRGTTVSTERDRRETVQPIPTQKSLDRAVLADRLYRTEGSPDDFLIRELAVTPDSTSTLIPSESPSFTARRSKCWGVVSTSTKVSPLSNRTTLSLMDSAWSRRSRMMSALAL